MQEKATIETVARRAGVSKSTVSYVLSGKRKISREIQDRVLKAARELSYRPNQIARSLSQRETKIVGLYVPHRNRRRSGDFYFYSMLEGVLDSLDAEGYRLLLNTSGNRSDDAEDPLGPTLPIDGGILMNLRKDHAYLNRLQEERKPFVAIGTPDTTDEVFYVDVDLVSASFLATRHLFGRGARRIFFINSPEDFIQSQQRLEGYNLGHSELGLEVEKPLVVWSDFTAEDGYAATRRALDAGLSFDAMLCCNDTVALGAINALREAQIAVPEKIPVMGMGGSAIGGITSPAITTVDFSPYEMGSLAAKLLIEVIQRKRIQPCHTILSPKLIIRDTA